MANKKSSKRNRNTDAKMAAANDTSNLVPRLTADEIAAQPEAPATPKVDPSTLKGVAAGIYFAGLAGRPSKPAVIACFGKAGYNMNWIQRAQKLGMETADLCAQFKADPAAVKAIWEKATIKS
jgi:hypothetical protein